MFVCAHDSCHKSARLLLPPWEYPLLRYADTNSFNLSHSSDMFGFLYKYSECIHTNNQFHTILDVQSEILHLIAH